MLLHELAHGFCGKRFGLNAVAAHGPEFVRTYTELLVRYLDFSGEALETSARIRGIHVAETSEK